MGGRLMLVVVALGAEVGPCTPRFRWCARRWARLRQVEAAVNADRAAARLALDLDADALLLASATDGPDRPPDPSEARIDVVREFADRGGWLGAIVPLTEAAAVLRGEPVAGVWGPGAGVRLA